MYLNIRYILSHTVISEYLKEQRQLHSIVLYIYDCSLIKLLPVDHDVLYCVTEKGTSLSDLLTVPWLNSDDNDECVFKRMKGTECTWNQS